MNLLQKFKKLTKYAWFGQVIENNKHQSARERLVHVIRRTRRVERCMNASQTWASTPQDSNNGSYWSSISEEIDDAMFE